MTIEQITDENYEGFRNSSRSVLMVSTSWCKNCKGYTPVIDTLSNKFPFIRFGKIVLDKDRSTEIKREYGNEIGGWILPTTLFFREKREALKIQGVDLYPNVLSKVNENLVLGSTIFIPNNGESYLTGIIKHVQDSNLYTVQLTANSRLGEKGQSVKLKEGDFEWGIESKVKQLFHHNHL